VLIGFDVKFILALLLLVLLLLPLNGDVVDSFWQLSNASDFSISSSREKADAVSDDDSGKKSILRSGMGEVTAELG
jgi:hypothetical protein